MPARSRLATVILVVALPLIPLVAGLAADGMGRELGLLLLIALVAGAFIVLLAGDPAGMVPVARQPSAGAAALRVARNLGTACLLAVILILLVFWVRADEERGLAWEKVRFVQYAAVAFFAGAVGFGELIARYRDDPSRLLGMRPATAYICINVTAGVLALALVQQFEVIPDGPNRGVLETLLAAFGAIAFFRTSLFTARVGDTDVGIGPSTMLKTFLEGSDRLVNRSQATDRADAVAATMVDVDFKRAKATLPAFCLGLVEGLSDDEQRELGEQIAGLDSAKGIDDAAKAHILGVYLLRQVGGTVLFKAVETLGPAIRRLPNTLQLPPEAMDPPE